MRGASALDDWLLEHGAPAAFVVWEPVLTFDRAPRKEVRYAHNYWDPARTRSSLLAESGFPRACITSSRGIVWDVIFDFPPNSDAPSTCGRTVLDQLPQLH